MASWKVKICLKEKNAESSNITLFSSKVGTLNDVDVYINQGKGEFRGIRMELEWGGGGGGLHLAQLFDPITNQKVPLWYNFKSSISSRPTLNCFKAILILKGSARQKNAVFRAKFFKKSPKTFFNLAWRAKFCSLYSVWKGWENQFCRRKKCRPNFRKLCENPTPRENTRSASESGYDWWVSNLFLLYVQPRYNYNNLKMKKLRDEKWIRVNYQISHKVIFCNFYTLKRKISPL